MVGCIDVKGINGTPLRVICVPKGEKSPNCAEAPNPQGLVEFYDLCHPHTPNGQFIARYDLNTYMNGWNGNSSYNCGYGLDLYGSEPNWKISANTRTFLGDWIKYLTKETTHA
jgi:hypothetical protein